MPETAARHAVTSTVAALHVLRHAACPAQSRALLPRPAAAAAARHVRRRRAHCRSSMTTAWQAMLRFSPRLSTFSCVLALMFTTLQWERSGNGRSVLPQRGPCLAGVAQAKVGRALRSASCSARSASRAPPPPPPHPPPHPPPRTWGARPASGRGCPGWPPCGGPSWGAAGDSGGGGGGGTRGRAGLRCAQRRQLPAGSIPRRRQPSAPTRARLARPAAPPPARAPAR